VERQLWAYALERGRGESFTLEDLHAATARAPYIHDPLNPEQFSIQPVLDRETAIIRLAQESANACASSLVPDWPGDARLDAAQAEAARRILSVRDSIVLFRGRAGTGKSFTLKTVYDALQAEGHAVQVLAPQRQQVEGLTQDGMAGAETISAFLTRRRMEPGAVVIVDEAGQIGAKDMLALLTFVKERGGRVILSGDTGQHGPVQASDALRAMEKYGHLHIAELNEIRRQDPARGRNKAERQWIATYKQAVQDASEGRLDQSFELLDEAGAVVECTLADKQQKLAEHYLELVRKKRSALVVSPTWGEIHRVNDAVRQRMRDAGLLGKKEWAVSALQADDLTDAQKGDARYYDDGRVIVFNQTCRGIPKGAVGSLVAVTAESIVVEAAGRVRAVPLAQAGHLTVCKKQEMKLSKGDRLQLKANAQTAQGKRFINGELVTVKRVEKNGKIHLDDGRVLPPEYREFVRGYAVTSYASQGKTVDHVLFSDSSIKAATNAEQWYVTISRGRIGVRIFTTDKARLRENVTRSGQERLAVEIAAKQVPQVRMGNCNHPDVIRKNQKGHETAKKRRLRHSELQNQNQHHDPVRTIQTVE
jgi:ATP-dependent exoDNAse (exonuclease V) alpha subunit